jgi:hypothetical protein
MSKVLNLTPDVLMRIIQEERQKLLNEAKRKKEKAVKGNKQPPEPKVKGVKSTVLPAVEKAKLKGKKDMHLDETEVQAADMAGTVTKKAKQLQEVRALEENLRVHLRAIVEKRSALERDLIDLI